MAERYLADTNVLIDYLAGNYPPAVLDWLDGLFDQEICLSIINRIEVLAFRFSDPAEENQVRNFIADAIIYPVDNAVAEPAILIRKNMRVKLPDAIIAATALHHGLTLLTRNTNDFKHVPGLALAAPGDFA
jgi:predicted nucleic acid-binding protein